jgi:hypothetical protein
VSSAIDAPQPRHDVGDSLVLLIDGRYNLGLTDPGAGGEDPSVKGRAFSIMARAGIKVN